MDVTLLLASAKSGEAGAADRLWQAVYQELRRIAGGKMAGERRQVTLQATALVHEAWLRLSGPDGEVQTWENRAHFFSAAAEAMRRVLVDQARRRLSRKRAPWQPDSATEIGREYTCSTHVVAGLHDTGFRL